MLTFSVSSARGGDTVLSALWLGLVLLAFLLVLLSSSEDFLSTDFVGPGVGRCCWSCRYQIVHWQNVIASSQSVKALVDENGRF